MIGVSRVAGLLLMRRHSSKPSIPGIITSVMTRSGICFDNKVQRRETIAGHLDRVALASEQRRQQLQVGLDVVDEHDLAAGRHRRPNVSRRR